MLKSNPINPILFENGPKAIILLHAYTSSPIDMYSLANALKREGYTVYAPVFSGHESGDITQILTANVEDWINDGRNALSFIKNKGYQDIAIFGLSLGGIIAMNTILENKEIVAGGTFCSPAVNSEAGTNILENFINLYKKQQHQLKKSESEIEESLPSVVRQIKGVLEDLRTLVSMNTERYPQVRQPIFIAQGGNDTMIDPSSGERFANTLINSKHIDFKFYKDAPHYITVGRYGKKLQTDFIPFLNNLNWS